MKSQSAEQNVRKDRRRFMKTVALGGATVGLGSTAAGAFALEPAEAPAQAQADAKPGYRVTEHVSTYYSKAEF